MKLTIDHALLMAVEAQNEGRVETADGLYTAILKSEPKHADANHNLGLIAIDLGKIKIATNHFRTAIRANSSIADFWISHVDAYVRLSKLKAAKKIIDIARGNGIDPGRLDRCIDKIRELKNRTGNMPVPLNPPVRMQKGIVDLYQKHEFLAALNQISKLASAYPNSAELYNLRGACLRQLDQTNAAIQCYRAAISLNPENEEFFNNLGNVLRRSGRMDEAVNSYIGALNINPSYDQAYLNLGFLLMTITFSRPAPEVRGVIIKMLKKGNLVRPKEISAAIVSLLRCDADLDAILQEYASASAEAILGYVETNFSQNELLLQFMIACPIPDLKFEELFKTLRRTILFHIKKILPNDAPLKFQIALATQCFNNEFLYELTSDEIKLIKQLEADIELNLAKNIQPTSQELLCLLSYRPFHTFKWHSLVQIKPELTVLYNQQVTNHIEEQKIKLSLNTLDIMTNDISLRVKDQYEESPYPRWMSTGVVPTPKDVSQIMRESRIRLNKEDICKVKEPNILIAGCGTGQHAIETAVKFKNSKVLAIDLSTSSLAYAQRKTNELNITNIEYMQADILQLSQLDTQFDIVESVGVLHHMAQPIDGWRVLTSMLKPGGLIKIGLYSKLARQHITQIRKEISQLGLGPDIETLRRFRKKIISSDSAHYVKITNSGDFYSASTLRDLLFHVQEHQFTIPEIRNSLEILGLGFCGFEPFPQDNKFKEIYKEGEATYDLNNWENFENKFPDTFGRMYQFWGQKF